LIIIIIDIIFLTILQAHKLQLPMLQYSLYIYFSTTKDDSINVSHLHLHIVHCRCGWRAVSIMTTE